MGTPTVLHYLSRSFFAIYVLWALFVNVVSKLFYRILTMELEILMKLSVNVVTKIYGEKIFDFFNLVHLIKKIVSKSFSVSSVRFVVVPLRFGKHI